MKTLPVLRIGLFALLLSSCATSHVEFNSNPNFHTKITRAFVQVKDVKLGFFLKILANNFVVDLSQSNVKVELLGTDILSLDSPNDVQEKIKNFNPDVIIKIERADTSVHHNKYGYSYNGGTYLVSIETLDSKIVWKASITTSEERNSDAGTTRIAIEAATQIIQQMKADGLL